MTHLTLAEFRSYSTAEISLTSGVTVFTGANGQGKTNLVEAIELLATLGSHRVSTDAPMIKVGAQRAIVRARVRAGLADDRSLLLELELMPGRANKASLNRSPLRRPRDLLGALRVVLFSPEDLAIVKGDPSERRRFIDDLVVARWPRLAGVRADYERVLKQRSTLLKSGRGQPRASAEVSATLDVWDAQLAELGAEIVAARLTTLDALAPELARAYAEIAPVNNEAVARYKSSWMASTDPDDSATEAQAPPLAAAELFDLLLQDMQRRRSEELARGVCLVGPHRDDLVLSLGAMPTRGYASHGESWSMALALRLASFSLLRTDGVEPVLILDDVFAELDETRRECLADLIVDAEQVLITAAVAADIPAGLQGHRFKVADGNVEPESPASPGREGHDG